jgi:hypothetical protein
MVTHERDLYRLAFSSMRKLVIISALSAVHLLVCRGLTFFGAELSRFTGEGYQTLPVSIVVWITRILYFPILTLSLYSRQWLPGNWVYVAISINSILWGIFLYTVWVVFKKFRESGNR